MGRIVANFFTTLDGVVSSPHLWHMPYFDDEMGQIVSRTQQSADAFLLGRVLHDEWSAYWSSFSRGGDDQGFADFINGVDKFVVSSTLTGSTWQNTTVLSPSDGDVSDQVRAVKDSVDGTIGMSGCATTVRWLLSEGLLDELNLLVDPIAVGEGQRLFEGTGRTPLRLVSSRALDTGVLHLVYAPESEG